jgi:hypothetical protein
MMMRAAILLIALTAATAAGAGDVEFSLNLDTFDWSPGQDVRTKARLAHWNDPTWRMAYHLNQQNAWIMRGTVPGGERMNSVAVRIKAQNGLPLNLLAATMQGGTDVDRQDLVRLGRRRADDDKLDLMTLEELLSEELGKKLAPK